jgi:CRP-like cAMP-binding protein
MKKSKTDCDCKTCLLCKLCLPEWGPAIAANKKNIRFKKGDIIINEGDAMTGMYFVYEGTVKVHKKWGEEKELIIRFAKSGDIFGHRGLGKDMIYPISATALEPVTACFFNNDFFKTSLRVNYDFSFQLLMFYAEELQESEKKMRNLAHMQVKGRVAYALMHLQKKFGVNKEGYINFNVSRQDLASYTGTTYETLFRVMNELTNDNIIEMSNKYISIKDENKLLSFTGQSG